MDVAICPQKPIIPIQPENLPVRKAIVDFEAKLRLRPETKIGDTLPLKHSFAEGMYVRELVVPAGVLTVTKIHKYAHPVFLMSGRVSILEEGGIKHVEGPAYFITPKGTKRVIYHHTEVTIVTVHKTDETDLDKIEDEIIAPTFDHITDVIDVKSEEIKLMEFVDQVKKGVNNDTPA